MVIRQGDAAPIPTQLERAHPPAGHTPVAADVAAMKFSRLAAELSHDMRVPLSAIVAGLELLEEELGEHPDPAVAGLLDRTAQAAARMMRMLDQHMAVDPVAVGRMRKDVDLCEVAHQLTVDSARPWRRRASCSRSVGCRSFGRTRTRCTPSCRTCSPTL